MSPVVVHGKRIRPYECEICGHRFSQKHHVAQHIQSKHEHDEDRQKPLACEVRLSYKTTMYRHVPRVGHFFLIEIDI